MRNRDCQCYCTQWGEICDKPVLCEIGMLALRWYYTHSVLLSALFCRLCSQVQVSATHFTGSSTHKLRQALIQRSFVQSLPPFILSFRWMYRVLFAFPVSRLPRVSPVIKQSQSFQLGPSPRVLKFGFTVLVSGQEFPKRLIIATRGVQQTRPSVQESLDLGPVWKFCSRWHSYICRVI